MFLLFKLAEDLLSLINQGTWVWTAIIFIGLVSVSSARFVFLDVMFLNKCLFLFQLSSIAHLVSSHRYACFCEEHFQSWGLLCLLTLTWRSAVGQMLRLGITSVLLASLRCCVCSVFTMTLVKRGSICDFWISFKPELRNLLWMDPAQMFSLLTGWHPAVTDGGRFGSSWTVSGPRLCFWELRPLWCCFLLCCGEFLTVDIQDGLAVRTRWGGSCHRVCVFVSRGGAGCDGGKLEPWVLNFQ